MSEATTPKKESSALSLPVAIVAGAILISASILFVGRGSSASPTGSADLSVRPASAEDHIIGSPNAPVVIVEYADLQCPYCALIHPTLNRIVSESNGQIAWVFRNFPLDSIHPEARPAAEAAECVAALKGNDAFWKFTAALFADQQDIGSDFFAKTAASLGTDPAAFAACISKKSYDGRIDADLAEAVQNGGQGTPFTVVVGKKGAPVAFSGALPYAQIMAVINSVKNRQ